MQPAEASFSALFNQFRDGILNVDPVFFCEKNLNVNGSPLKLNSGYKPFADIYRYIGLKAISPNSKPIVLVKGRQVGATTMAAAMECYFAGCGIFGRNGRPGMRIMHLFPTLSLAAAYTKDKLDPIIGQSRPVPGTMKANGLPKTFMENIVDSASPANNSMHFKKFNHGNQIWIESTGLDGDRIRGRSVDIGFFDECLPADQLIETEDGNIPIGVLYDNWAKNKKLPLVKTYNEKTKIFEFKKITKAWNRGHRKVVKLFCGNVTIKCTPNHPFLTSDNWVKAENLKVGDWLLTTSSDYTDAGIIVITSITPSVDEEVFDISVEGNHNFVIKNDNRRVGVIAHNCQDMPDIAIGTATKTLTKSNYGVVGDGVQVYFGTPKTKGGSYWKMWQQSSQNYFHLRCEKCGKYFPLYRPDIKWEDVWIYGLTVKCTDCGHEQDKLEAQERGKWIPLNNPDECAFIGYHINMLYIPEFTRETIEKHKPENNPVNTERVYMNEVLGEFFDGEGGTITSVEIKEKCVDKNRRMVARISQEGKRVYAGFDWGQRSSLEQIAGRGKGRSYSCGVILTVEGSLFNIQFATRLSNNGPEYKENTVDEMFRRYNMALAVGDIGDASDLTHKLQEAYGDKFLASRSCNRVIGHVKYDSDIWPKEIKFEKDYYISELLGLLKQGRVKFPGGNGEKIHWLIDHCASMDIKITKDKSGEPIKKFVKGNGPNDGFMALLNAYIAWKFDVTQGFTISDPKQMKYDITNSKRNVQAVLGYIPR